MFSAITVALCFLFAVILWTLRAKKSYEPHRKDQAFFIGDLANFQANLNSASIHDFLYKTTVECGNKTWYASLPTKSFCCVTSPECVKYMLSDNFSNYEKGAEFQSNFGELLGQGIFAVDGDLWKIKRKVAAKLFSWRILRTKIQDAFLEHAHDAYDFLDEAADSKVSTDMQQFAFRFTFDSICDIAFGRKVDSLVDTTIGVDENGIPTALQFVQDFDQSNIICSKRFMNVQWIWKLQRLLGIGQEAALKHHVARINAYVNDVVQARRENPDTSKHKDVLSLFLANDDTLTDEQLRDVAMNFLIAGRDTTGWALTIMLYLMDKHPEVERKIREEIKAIVGTQEPSLDLCKSMVYTKAAFYEALRLYPSVPYDGKFAVKDDVMPDGSKIDAGMMVWYPAYVLGRQESVWGPDASQYRPDRWLDPDFETPSNFKFSAFNAGPRLCLGKEMATFEVQMFMALILPKYRFTLSPSHQFKMPMAATFSFVNGMAMTVEKL